MQPALKEALAAFGSEVVRLTCKTCGQTFTSTADAESLAAAVDEHDNDERSDCTGSYHIHNIDRRVDADIE